MVGFTGLMIVMFTISERSAVRLMMGRWRARLKVLGRAGAHFDRCDNAFHRDSRKRLNRKAQREQDDNEEFAPGRHGSEV